MARFRDWVEPAHPAVVERFDDLVDIFKFLRDDFQLEIDKAFDKISRQIGFVVTTTLPVTIQVGDGAKIKSAELGTPNLEGTLFESEFAPTLKRLAGKPVGKTMVAAGRYSLVFLWFDALKLKLKHDWVEPAHFRGISTRVAEDLAAKVRPEVQEPAHWFDGGITLEMEEELLISVIDEVYPELKLADRISFGRRHSRALIPGVREPAHFRDLVEGLIDERFDARKLIPGVREPAHFHKVDDLLQDPAKVQMLRELSSLLQRLGF